MTAAVLLLALTLTDEQFTRGMALARAGRLDEARAALENGWRAAPSDKRFPIELAGLAYVARDHSRAKRLLHRALEIDSADLYANDFLGTLYFLEENYEAALKYWNRAGKPALSRVSIDGARSETLVRRAIPAIEGEPLSREAWETARARLAALLDGAPHRLGLATENGRDYELQLVRLERPRWAEAAAMFSGVPYRTLYPQLHDAGSQSVHLDGLVRWDTFARRADLAVSGPVAANPKWLWQLRAGVRREVWNLGGGGDRLLSRLEGGASLRSIPSGRFQWTTGVDLVRRADASSIAGYWLQPVIGAQYAPLLLPERRLSLTLAGSAAVARAFNPESARFARFQAGADLRWRPRLTLDLRHRLRFGTVAGEAPFDELFQLGLDRDHDLRLRAQRNRRDGKKGVGPLGSSFALSNFDLSQSLLRRPFLTIEAGPFLDAARAAGHWRTATGVQLRLRPLPGLTVGLSCGWDLRSAKPVLFPETLR